MFEFVWQGHFGPDRDGELDHCQSTVRVGGLEQKLDSYLAGLDEFALHNALTSRTVTVRCETAIDLEGRLSPWHRHAGLIKLRPFLAAAAIILLTNSSVISGGDAERSVVGLNDSSKNCCMPVG